MRILMPIYKYLILFCFFPITLFGQEYLSPELSDFFYDEKVEHIHYQIEDISATIIHVVASLPIKAHSPWWKSVWFISFLILAVFFFHVFLFRKYFFYFRQIRLNNQQAMISLNQKDEMLEQKNEQLRELSEKEHEINQMKLRFFTNISHEIRTPLTLLLSPLDSLLEKLEDEDAKIQVDIMKRNARKLLNLVNQLLDFRKIEEGGVRLFVSETNFGVFVFDMIQAFRGICDQRHIHLQYEKPAIPVKLWIDIEKMDKILGNLIFNAIKYTPEHGTVAVSIELDTLHSLVKLFVKDTGKGIPAKDLDHIFERYYQARESLFGSGIGLSLTYDLIKLHQGDIAVSSEEGKGTCFILTLPMGNDHLANKENIVFNEKKTLIIPESSAIIDFVEDLTFRDTEDHRINKKHKSAPLILIVEDNVDLRGYIVEELRENFNVLEAGTGEEGMGIAFSMLPDLVISDIMMNNGDGIALCKSLKSNLLTSHIPIILLTALSTEEHMEAGFNCGADDYIIKPFCTRLLKSRVKNLLSNRRRIKDKLLNDFSHTETHQEIPESVFLQKVIQVIESNMTNPDLCLSLLVKELSISQAQLYRKIKALTGLTVNDFSKMIRLKKAALLLKENNMNITEISFEVGFNNPRYFSDCFKEVYKISPKKYMADAKKGI